MKQPGPVTKLQTKRHENRNMKPNSKQTLHILPSKKAVTSGSSAVDAASSGGSAAEAVTSGGTGADSWTGEASVADSWTGEASGADSWTGEASGVQCAAHTLKMVTAITGSAADSGMPAVLESEETTGMSAARTDISGGSNTLVTSLLSPGPSSASAGALVLCPPQKKNPLGKFW